jgi:ferrous iron transport protein B
MENNWPATAALFTGIVAKELVVAGINAANHSEYNSFLNGFDGYAGMLAYLVFVLLYFPCISTFFTMAREISYKCAALSLTWSISIAYLCAALVYQFGTITFLMH